MDENYSNGIQKLYNCVSKGLGVLMMPKDVREIIDREAKQIEMIDVDGGMVGEIVEAYQGEQSIEAVKALYGRTCSRLLYQEMRKQENIEMVVDKAKTLLVSEECVNGEEVNEDWVSRFFNSVQDVSNEDMQRLWGRILAGEVKRPNSFSLRCLDTLSKMTRQEAMIFESLRPYIINFRGTWAIINEKNLNEKYKIHYEKILSMAECGLMDSSGIMKLNLKVQNQYPLQIVYDEELLKTSNDEERKIELPIYKLTQTGIELLHILDEKYNKDYFQDVARWLAKRNGDVEFMMHKVISKNSDGSFQYLVSGTKIEKE